MFHIKNYQLNMTLIINIFVFAIVSSIPCEYHLHFFFKYFYLLRMKLQYVVMHINDIVYMFAFLKVCLHIHRLLITLTLKQSIKRS